MKTVGNDQLHENRKWYLGLGALLVLFGIVLLTSLPFATLSIVFLFGVLMMIGGVVHLIAGIKIFDGGISLALAAIRYYLFYCGLLCL